MLTKSDYAVIQKAGEKAQEDARLAGESAEEGARRAFVALTVTETDCRFMNVIRIAMEGKKCHT